MNDPTNAARQARWRQRREAQLAQLRGRLAAAEQAAKPQARPTGDALSAARGLVREVLAQHDLDPKIKQQANKALSEIGKAQAALRRVDAALAGLPLKGEAVRRKVRALADAGSGATDGERAAAEAALKRLPEPERVRLTPEPPPLPRTAEEMLARKRG